MIVHYYTQYDAHIKNLAKRHRIRIQTRNKLLTSIGRDMLHAESNKWHRYIVIPDINTEENYLTALHEIGHILHPLGTYGDFRFFTDDTSLTEEAAAWSWAFTKSKIDVKPEECDFAKFCYGTYYKNAAKMGYVKPYHYTHPTMREVNNMHQLLTNN